MNGPRTKQIYLFKLFNVLGYESFILAGILPKNGAQNVLNICILSIFSFKQIQQNLCTKIGIIHKPIFIRVFDLHQILFSRRDKSTKLSNKNKMTFGLEKKLVKIKYKMHR